MSAKQKKAFLTCAKGDCLWEAKWNEGKRRFYFIKILCLSDGPMLKHFKRLNIPGARRIRVYTECDYHYEAGKWGRTKTEAAMLYEAFTASFTKSFRNQEKAATRMVDRHLKKLAAIKAAIKKGVANAE